MDDVLGAGRIAEFRSEVEEAGARRVRLERIAEVGVWKKLGHIRTHCGIELGARSAGPEQVLFVTSGQSNIQTCRDRAGRTAEQVVFGSERDVADAACVTASVGRRGFDLRIRDSAI